MSMDRSLKSASSLFRHRNVLTRGERLLKLGETGKWDESKSPLGLVKVGHRKAAVVKAVKEVAADGTTPAAAGAAAPAAGAKAAAPAAGAGAKGAAAAKGAAPAPAAKAAPAAKKK